VRLWDRAHDPETAAGCRRDELLAAAADAANRCGLLVRALTLVDEALASPAVAADPVRAGLLHERRGWYLHRTGRPTDALAAHELAAANVPGIYPPEERSGAAPAFEVCFVTDDVQRAFDRAITEGAVAVTAPQTKPWGQDVAYVRDPDGNLVELASPTGPP